MPHYKISPLLNNCGLNIAVPYVIGKLGDREVSAGIPGIKECFKTYYRLQDTPHHQALHTFLSRKNFLAQQLILGPVLREFAQNNMIREDASATYVYNELIDKSETEDEKPGMFRNTTPDTLEKYILNPIGLSAKIIHLEDAQESVVRVAKENFQNITVYLKKGHYELEEVPPQEKEARTCPFYQFKQQIEKASFIDPSSNDPNNSPAKRVANVLKEIKEYITEEYTKTPPRPILNYKPYNSFFKRPAKAAILGFGFGGAGAMTLAIAAPELFKTISFGVHPLLAILILATLIAIISSSITALTQYTGPALPQDSL